MATLPSLTVCGMSRGQVTRGSSSSGFFFFFRRDFGDFWLSNCAVTSSETSASLLFFSSFFFFFFGADFSSSPQTDSRVLCTIQFYHNMVRNLIIILTFGDCEDSVIRSGCSSEISEKGSVASEGTTSSSYKQFRLTSVLRFLIILTSDKFIGT